MSSYFDDPMVLRQIIMDHYSNPRNHQLKKLIGYKGIHMASESCIDDLHIELKLNGNKIEDTGFDGVGCTISTASTSIMSELLKGKTIEEAKNIIDHYLRMVNEQEYDADVLEELIAFKTVYKQANRIKCATIGIKGFLQLLEEGETHE